MDMEVIENPSRAQLARLVDDVDALVPSPGYSGRARSVRGRRRGGRPGR